METWVPDSYDRNENLDSVGGEHITHALPALLNFSIGRVFSNALIFYLAPSGARSSERSHLIAWGWHDERWALIALQVGLFATNVHGIVKNEGKSK